MLTDRGFYAKGFFFSHVHTQVEYSIILNTVLLLPQMELSLFQCTFFFFLIENCNNVGHFASCQKGLCLFTLYLLGGIFLAAQASANFSTHTHIEQKKEKKKSLPNTPHLYIDI